MGCCILRAVEESAWVEVNRIITVLWVGQRGFSIVVASLSVGTSSTRVKVTSLNQQVLSSWIEVASVWQHTSSHQTSIFVEHVGIHVVRWVQWIQTTEHHQLFTDDFTFQWVTWQVRECQRGSSSCHRSRRTFQGTHIPRLARWPLDRSCTRSRSYILGKTRIHKNRAPGTPHQDRSCKRSRWYNPQSSTHLRLARWRQG